MKITDIHAYPLICEMKQPFAYSQKWVRGRSALLLEIETDEGIRGWGEVFCQDAWPAVVALLERVYRPLLIGTGLAIAVALHFIAALPPQPSSLNALPPLLELDRSENPIRDRILVTPIELKDGFATVPQGPGLGVEVDRNVLAKYRADR